MSRTTNRQNFLRAGALVAAGLLVAGLSSPAAAGKPDDAGPPETATKIVFTAIGNSVDTPLPATPGSAQGTLVYIEQDKPFLVDLSFQGDDGTPLPLSWNKRTTVTLTASGQTGSWSVDVAPGDKTATVPVTLPTAKDGVALSASAPGPKNTTVTGGPSGSFDVLIDSSSDNRIGLTVDDSCADTCARLVSPDGGFDSGTLLSRGFCATNPGDCVGGKYVQALAAFAGDGIGDRNDPATLIVTCDKDVCGTGAIHSHSLNVQLTPGGQQVDAPECPAKGVVGALQDFCVDYVQSTRDNSGDTHLYLLFIVDAKVRWM